MKKVIGAINMTLDGFCDHTAISPDDEIHQHYAELLSEAGSILYGRITFQLMEFWKTLVEKPSGNKSLDEFALIMDKVSKIVFSKSLNTIEPIAIGWESARLTKRSLEEEVLELKRQADKDIFVGSRSLIIQLMKLNLLDELQLCIHPVIVGSGLPLFEKLHDRTILKLTKTKTFSSGAVILYYEMTDENRIDF
ncbi:MAG: dihydrofolate reductase family protein [Bacteroidota bacterium]